MWAISPIPMHLQSRSLSTPLLAMPPKKLSKPFARGSPAHNFLKSKLQSADISADDRPKKVRDTYKVELVNMGISPTSSQNSFRAMFHRAKEEFEAEKGKITHIICFHYSNLLTNYPF